MLLNIILSTLVISLFSLVGVLTLSLKEKFLKKIILVLVSLSAGALIGGAFFHLLPESIEGIGVESSMVLLIMGIITFFVLEKVLYWRHCHKKNCKVHTFGYMNLVGDSVHNFIDGLIIAASFVSSMSLGVISTFAIGLHEIPQELGDFGVLIHSGLSKKKALTFNLLTALTAVIGGFIGYYLSSSLANMTSYLVAFASGGFIYISSSDLIPEIRKENDKRKWITNLAVFLAGIILMFLITVLE